MLTVNELKRILENISPEAAILVGDRDGNSSKETIRIEVNYRCGSIPEEGVFSELGRRGTFVTLWPVDDDPKQEG